MQKPLVSVVVPTKNSSATIGRCLESIKSQTYGNVEIIVVDSCSSDNTRSISNNHGAKIIVSRAKRSEARNIGFQNSSGGLLFFVDSDMELTVGVISECADKLAEGNDAVIVPEISTGQGFWAKCKALERSCYSGDDLVEGIRFMKRSPFEEIGGYDVKLEAGEDWDLCNRFRAHGYKITRVSESIKHNEGKLSLRRAVSKKYYYSHTLSGYVEKYPSLSKRQLSPFRKAYLRNWRRLVSNPLYAVGFGVLKTCEYFGGLLGYRLKVDQNVQDSKKGRTYANRKPEDRKIYMINYLLPLRNSSVLDLGCGNGLYLGAISHRARQVVGFDVSAELCKLAKRKHFEVVRGDAMHLPFQNGIFDVIWASEVVEHMPSLGVFDELERVALNSIIATLPNPYSSNYNDDSQHQLSFSFSLLREHFNKRERWDYGLFGLGLEFSGNPKGIRIPKVVKFLTLHLTFRFPLLAPTFCIIGRNKSARSLKQGH